MDNKDSLSKLLENDNVSNPFFINNDIVDNPKKDTGYGLLLRVIL